LPYQFGDSDKLEQKRLINSKVNFFCSSFFFFSVEQMLSAKILLIAALCGLSLETQAYTAVGRASSMGVLIGNKYVEH